MQLLPNNRQDRIKADDDSEAGGASALICIIRAIENTYRELARRITSRRRCRIRRGTRCAAGRKGSAGRV